jgi:hypothetical protein
VSCREGATVCRVGGAPCGTACGRASKGREHAAHRRRSWRGNLDCENSPSSHYFAHLIALRRVSVISCAIRRLPGLVRVCRGATAMEKLR